MLDPGVGGGGVSEAGPDVQRIGDGVRGGLGRLGIFFDCLHGGHLPNVLRRIVRWALVPSVGELTVRWGRFGVRRTSRHILWKLENILTIVSSRE